MKVEIEITRDGYPITVAVDVEEHAGPMGRVDLGNADELGTVVAYEGALVLASTFVLVGHEIQLTVAERYKAETVARRKAIRGFEDAAAAAGESSCS